MQKALTTLIFISIFVVSYAQEEIIGYTDVSESAIAKDKIAGFNEAIQIYPFGLLVLNFAGNYEKLLQKRHGLMVEGNFQLMNTENSNYGLGLHYRYHYFSKPKHRGMNSPYCGPFIKYNHITGTAWEEDMYGRKDYTMSVDALRAGINWGRRWVWNSGFNINFRIGYGLPIHMVYNWQPAIPEAVNQIEALMTTFSGIDGELTAGFAF